MSAEESQNTQPTTPPVNEEGNGGDATNATYPAAEPSMAQMFQMMQQQNQLLMNVVMGKGQGKGGDGSGVPAYPQMIKPTSVPEFSGAGFEAWRKRVSEWESVHFALDPRQKAGALMAGLKGEALQLARAAVPVEKLQDPASFQLLLDTMRVHYGDNAAMKQFRKFQSLIALENTGDNLESYLRLFTIRTQDAAEESLVLPEILQVYLLLHGSKLHAGQIQQVMATTEQMAAAHGSTEPRLQDVKHVLKSMAQARNLRSGPSRRPRNHAFAAQPVEGDRDATDVWDDDGERHDDAEEGWSSNEEWDEVNEEQLHEDPEYIAAVAQLKKRFAKKYPVKGGKGKEAKGAGKGGKPPGSRPRRKRDCKYKGENSTTGDMRCNKLRDNQKCDFEHTKVDLDMAREKLKAKGAIPTFNAWDASDSFEGLSKHLGSKCILDSGAKKTVTGANWLKRYERKLKIYRKKATNMCLKSDERPRVFQFGGGTKTSTGRKRIPFMVKTKDGSLEWREVVADIVPGWMPLLFSYDSQKHHRMYVKPEDDLLYITTTVYKPCNDAVVENGNVDDRTGIMVLEMLPDVKGKLPNLETDLSDYGNAGPTAEGLEVPGEDGTTLAAIAPVATDSQADLWKLYKSTEVRTDTETLVRTDAATIADATNHGRTSVGAFDDDAAVETDSRLEPLQSAGHVLAVSGPKNGRLEPQESAGHGPVALVETRTDDDSQQMKLREVHANAATSREFDTGATIAPSMPDGKTETHAAPAKRKAPPDGAAIIRTKATHPETSGCHNEKDDGREGELAEVSDGPAKGKTRPMTRERLVHLHQLTKHTLSVTALKNLMKRAQVPNIQKAIEWYKDIVARCGCSKAEYLHRHRLPRLKLDDMGFNDEIEMDLMKLVNVYFLVMVDRGTRFIRAVRLRNKEANSARFQFLCRWVMLFGAPVGGLSDCGSEFMSREFLEATDLFSIFKECTPAYASDRHALVERVIRTLREAAERAVVAHEKRPTLDELDLIVSICENEANNDLQPCGTSAAERAFGRSTSPFLSLMQEQVPPAPSELATLQKKARNAWREAANDRSFQMLLSRQLGPQAMLEAPELGALMYYRRPNPLNDGPIYRGPAEVIGISHRTDQAFLSHGGLLVRVAFEDLKPVLGTQQRKETREGPTAPDGSPAAALEELDLRDGPAPEPPDPVEPPVVVVPEVRVVHSVEIAPPLEPAPPDDGCGSLGDDSRLEPASPGSPLEPDGTAAGSPVHDDSAPATPERPAPADPLSVLTDHYADPFTPAINPADLADWYADGESEPGLEFLPPEDAAEHDIFSIGDPEDVPGADPELDDETPATVPERPADASPRLASGDVQVGDPDLPHCGLQVGDRVHVEVPSEKGMRWYSGEVFSLPADRPDRVSLRWEDTKPNMQEAERFETLNLSQVNWRPLRPRRAVRAARLGPAPPVTRVLHGRAGALKVSLGRAGASLVVFWLRSLPSSLASRPAAGGLHSPPRRNPRPRDAPAACRRFSPPLSLIRPTPRAR